MLTDKPEISIRERERRASASFHTRTESDRHTRHQHHCRASHAATLKPPSPGPTRTCFVDRDCTISGATQTFGVWNDPGGSEVVRARAGWERGVSGM